ncbi:Cytosolic Fe-S cluster assembly factor NAR1 [Escovopsis weberi]|uniref:Cytosolic Fe-S cluster assembly factor NAR1 n=1 Tax=Escovopsis weberi TaxID=150374 RepID=A0A0N0RSU9_ESCWE|nr:Cytosolic Fe-S cluster assembly factor NAR1 [Escovopsis weberi]
MSAILSADDLNDFISPGVACVKPVETLPPDDNDNENDKDNDNEVAIDGEQHHSAAGAVPAPAQISLTDCLACSGCVTSAEAVLVSLQSHAEVLSALDAAPALRIAGPDAATGAFRVEGLEDEGARLFVASVSPQTRANLAAACGRGVSEEQAGRMLEHMLRGEAGLAGGGRWRNAFHWVLDTNTAREATLVLGADEVLGAGVGVGVGVGAPTPPILAASCPGWVCYAEKTHPHVLPHLSRVKSPQAMLGTMVKTALSRTLGIPPSRIWHLAVMPCFDKKLEASREELTDQAWAGPDVPGNPGKPGKGAKGGVRDVDCVITSKEVLMLAESRGVDFFGLGTGPPPGPQLAFPDRRLHEFLFPSVRASNSPRAAGSSGGLLYHILQRKAAQTPGAEIQITRGRNADVVEYAVAVGGEPTFKAARYYGFRNIQNLVRRLKPARPSRMPNGGGGQGGGQGGGGGAGARRPAARKTAALEYGYVEVMACPGGCTNGGGQIKADDAVVVARRELPEKPDLHDQRAWLAEVDEAYFSEDEAHAAVAGLTIAGDRGRGEREEREEEEEEEEEVDVVGGISRSHVHETLAHWSDITGIGLDRLAFTTYRQVTGIAGTEATAGAEGVAQLAGKAGGGW